jgi:hypothetical protein
MARHDNAPFRGEHDKRAFPVVTGSTFQEGDIVRLDGNGFLTEAGDDPPAVLGVAGDSATNILYGVGLTGASSAPEGTYLGVWIAGNNRQFRTENFATDGAGTAAVPTQLNAVGQTAGFTLAAGVWTLDTGTANFVAVIDDVLDANGHSISNPNVIVGAGVTVIYHLT